MMMISLAQQWKFPKKFLWFVPGYLIPNSDVSAPPPPLVVSIRLWAMPKPIQKGRSLETSCTSQFFTDIGDPVMECPEFEVTSYPTMAKNEVRATDNSGTASRLSRTTPIVIEQTSSSLIFTVTWTARDDSGNTDKCTITYIYKTKSKTNEYRFVFTVLRPCETITHGELPH